MVASSGSAVDRDVSWQLTLELSGLRYVLMDFLPVVFDKLVQLRDDLEAFARNETSAANAHVRLGIRRFADRALRLAVTSSGSSCFIKVAS